MGQRASKILLCKSASAPRWLSGLKAHRAISFRSTITFFITARKRSLGQGNMFTGVCLSTGGEYLTRYTPQEQTLPPGPGTPPRSRHPPGPGTSPRSRQPPRPGTPPRSRRPPKTRYTPRANTPSQHRAC